MLVRAGYLRHADSGARSYLLLGRRTLGKIEGIARREMAAAAGQELLLPLALPGALAAGDVAASIARGEVQSYKQLPQFWYALRTELHEERSSKRVHESLVVDAWSFEMNREMETVEKLCSRILERCAVETNLSRNSNSLSWFTPYPAGEATLARCSACGYAAEQELAFSRAARAALADPEGGQAPESFSTPDRKTIAEVSEFTGLPETSQMKSLVLVADGRPVLALVRGDHSLSEAKFQAATGASEIRPARADEIRAWFGADGGSLGPVGVKNMRIIVDRALEGRRNMIAGANRDGYHLRNVTPDKDFSAEYLDLRLVNRGDGCVHCGTPLEFVPCARVAQVSTLAPRDLTVLNEQGQQTPVAVVQMHMDLERLLYAAAEAHRDCDGLALPASMAPFSVALTPVNWADASQRSAAGQIYEECRSAGLDVILDDRDERPGIKFKDADLIGFPYRITIGKKLAQGQVEVTERRSKRVEQVETGRAARYVRERLDQ